MQKLKWEVEAAKIESEKLKQIERLKKMKPEEQKAKSTESSPVAIQRKDRVVDFLCQNENSRLLPGRKDTVTKKTKTNRRVLVKPLIELHL